MKSAAANQALHPEGCLFCRRHDGGFLSEEHIFSEGLGNTDYVLPPGIVCDRCNSGPLARALELGSSRLHFEVEDLSSRPVQARLEQGRDPERVLELEVADRVDRGRSYSTQPAIATAART